MVSPSLDEDTSDKPPRRPKNRRPRRKKIKLSKQALSGQSGADHNDGIFFVDTSASTLPDDFREALKEVRAAGGEGKTVPDYVGGEGEVRGEEVAIVDVNGKDGDHANHANRRTQRKHNSTNAHESISMLEIEDSDGMSGSTDVEDPTQHNTVTSTAATEANSTGTTEAEEEGSHDLEDEDGKGSPREVHRYFKEDDPLQTCHRCGESGHSVRRCEHVQVSRLLSFRHHHGAI